MVLGLVFIDQILYAFGASAKTLPYAKDYMGVILLGAVVNLSGFSLNGDVYKRQLGNSSIPFRINTIGLIANIILDPLLIFGFGPIDALGTNGAGIATITAQIIVTCVFVGLSLIHI